jgi:hypothetical protein
VLIGERSREMEVSGRKKYYDQVSHVDVSNFFNESGLFNDLLQFFLGSAKLCLISKKAENFCSQLSGGQSSTHIGALYSSRLRGEAHGEY